MTAQHRLATELVLLALLALLWGSSYLFIRVALDTIPPVTLIAIRVSVASAFLMAVVMLRGERLPRDRRTWGMLLVQSFLNSIGAWTVLAWGQQFVDSGLASVLNSTSPIFIFFITYFLTRHESVNPRKLAGACVGLVGVVLIVGPDVLGGLGQQVAAQGAIILGALLYAGAAIYGKRFPHLSPTVTAAGTMIWATVCLVPLSLALESPWTLQPSAVSLAAALALSIACTGIALLIYFRLVRTLGSMGVASQAYLRAGIGVLLGVMVLGETFTSLIGAGLAAAIIGVALINFPERRRTVTADKPKVRSAGS